MLFSCKRCNQEIEADDTTGQMSGCRDPACPQNEPVEICDECGFYPADWPSRLCQGCEAYHEHQGV